MEALSKTIRCKPQRIWNYRDAHFLKACELIQSTNWVSLLSDDVDLSAGIFLILWKSVYLKRTSQDVEIFPG